MPNADADRERVIAVLLAGFTEMVVMLEADNLYKRYDVALAVRSGFTMMVVKLEADNLYKRDDIALALRRGFLQLTQQLERIEGDMGYVDKNNDN